MSSRRFRCCLLAVGQRRGGTRNALASFEVGQAAETIERAGNGVLASSHHEVFHASSLHQPVDTWIPATGAIVPRASNADQRTGNAANSSNSLSRLESRTLALKVQLLLCARSSCFGSSTATGSLWHEGTVVNVRDELL